MTGQPPGGGLPPLLEVRDLTQRFTLPRRSLRRRARLVAAVDGVSLTLHAGETLGVVGESGCGKSTLARSILQLHQPTGGEVDFDGVPLTTLGAARIRRLRSRMQMVFQDPYASLNPRMTVGAILTEAVRTHGAYPPKETPDRVRELLADVGLPADAPGRYPHEFSGGQCQRLGIARALAARPELIVADEPVSALDMSVRSQIINLFRDLQERHGLSYLFISHDLSVIRYVSHRVAVMYLGRIVELADRDDIFAGPMHPYTRALLSAVPVPDPRVERSRERIILRGDLPSPLEVPTGCRFRTRCWQAQEICASTDPPLVERAPGQFVACHLPLASPLQ